MGISIAPTHPIPPAPPYTKSAHAHVAHTRRVDTTNEQRINQRYNNEESNTWERTRAQRSEAKEEVAPMQPSFFLCVRGGGEVVAKGGRDKTRTHPTPYTTDG